MTDYNVITQTEEQKEAGAFVASQGFATKDGFGRVSQLWYKQTMSYDEALSKLFHEQKERHDIVSDLRKAEFIATNHGVKVCVDDSCYVPTEWGFRQLLGANALDVGTTCLNELGNGDIGDSETLVHIMTNGQRKLDKELVRRFRTYTDGTLRAVVSDSYSPVDNQWMIEMVRDIIPTGRVSHFDKSDADDMVLNILIPDNMFPHNGSDYGGGASLMNSEIGRYVVGSRPFAFSTICMNGNIWGEQSGVAFRQRHRGIMNLDELRNELQDCITKQLALVEVHNKTLIASHDWKASTSVDRIFAAVTKQHVLSKELFGSMRQQWQNHSGLENAFGVVDAMTRSAQLFGQAEMVTLNSVAGELIDAGRSAWEVLNVRAGAMTDKEFAKFAT